MPSVSDLKQSRFITKDDVKRPLLLTIKGYSYENVAMKDEPAEQKYCLEFMEFDKPLVLNISKGLIIQDICGSDNFDDWKGNQIVLFHDPTVMMGGKRVGGIGVRAPRNIAPVPKPTPPPRPPAPRPPPAEPAPSVDEPPENDDVPF